MYASYLELLKLKAKRLIVVEGRTSKYFGSMLRMIAVAFDSLPSSLRRKEKYVTVGIEGEMKGPTLLLI